MFGVLFVGVLLFGCCVCNLWPLLGMLVCCCDVFDNLALVCVC